MTTHLRRLALIGNHLPRQCGIATFTTDLSKSLADAAPELDALVVAMNDAGREHSYPAQVRFEVAEDDLAAYRRAAQYLNASGVELVSLQHEYGIFGGKDGSHVLTLLRELRVPVVATLHTILTSPSPQQRVTLEAVIEMSERVVVMSEHGATTLRELHGVSAAEVEFGLRYLPMDRPPTVTEFRAICHRAPQTAPARQMIAGPRPDLQRLREQLGKLRDVLVSAKRPKRQWIDDLLAKQRRGEELSVAQRINLALALRAPALDEDGDRDKLDRRKQETQRMVERYLRGTQ